MKITLLTKAAPIMNAALLADFSSQLRSGYSTFIKKYGSPSDLAQLEMLEAKAME